MTGHHSKWEETSGGGVRRPRLTQKRADGTPTDSASAGGVREATEAPGQSATRIKWRRMVRILHRVLKIKLNEKLGLPDCPYVIRWRVEFPFGSIRVHHWLSNDDDRATHDHPWWFITLVVKGYYYDASGKKAELLQAPVLRFRPAT